MSVSIRLVLKIIYILSQMANLRNKTEKYIFILVLTVIFLPIIKHEKYQITLKN